MSTCRIIKEVEILKTLFETFAKHPHLEIEAKLGVLSRIAERNQFRSGVTKDEFLRIHDMLTSYKGWSKESQCLDWIPTYDYFLENTLLGRFLAINNDYFWGAN